MNRETILLEDGRIRLHTSNDVISIGSETDYVNTASMVVTGTNNVTIDNIDFPREVGLYNGYSSYKHPSAPWYFFYTGDFWALNNGSKTDNFEDCVFTCPNQIGIYKANYGVTGNSTEAHVSRTGDQEGLSVTSNGLFDATYLTTNYLTLNQSRIFFDSTSNSNRLNALDTLDIAVLFQTDNDNTFAVPTGCVDDWAIQTFTTVLVGTDSTNVSDTSFDDTFVTDESLGVTEWIYTSNFRTDGNHYTDNLVDDDSLEIAGIEHNTALGVQVNTPNSRPHWGTNGQVAFARDTRRMSIRYSTNTPNYPEFPDWRVLGDMYQEYMDAMDTYKEYYVRNRTSSLSVETINLTTNISGGTSYQVSSKINLADGSCYFPSDRGDASLWIELDGTPNTVTGAALYGHDTALSPTDNNVYLLPFGDRNIVVQSTSNWTPQTLNTIPSANWTGSSYRGCVIADDGSVHFTPSGSGDEFIEYNPSTNIITPYATISTTSNIVSCLYACVNKGGTLYQTPVGHIDGKWYIRKIDPVNQSYQDIELFDSTQAHRCATSIPYKDKIYFFAEQSESVQKLWYFDTTDNSSNYVTSTEYDNMGSGMTGVLGPDGCYYFIDNSQTLFRVDLEKQTSEVLLTSLGSGYSNLALAANGYLNIVDVAYNGTMSDFKRVKLFDVPIDPNFLCNRYLNTT